MPSPVRRLAHSIHSSRVWAREPFTVPMVLAGIPSDSGMLLSVEPGERLISPLQKLLMISSLRRVRA